MPITTRRFPTMANIEITTADGQEMWLVRSITYNASITAVELRTVRGDTDPPMVLGKGPLRINVKGCDGTTVRAHLIHYEAVTFIPFECFAADEPIGEVYILRGARVEHVTP